MDLESYTSELMSAAKGEIVKFTFKHHEGKVVRCLKSFLVDRSPVFAAQFNETWDKNKVELDDPMMVDEYERFKLFIEVLIKVKRCRSLDLDEAIYVYYYADKYQINNLKFIIENVVSDLQEETAPCVLEKSLEMVDKFGFNVLKEAIDGTKIFILDDRALDLYNTCKQFKMEKLTLKIVDYMSKMDYDVSWPPALLIEIAKWNRQDSQSTERSTCKCRSKPYERKKSK